LSTWKWRSLVRMFFCMMAVVIWWNQHHISSTYKTPQRLHK
jgi:hypothetical protein